MCLLFHKANLWPTSEFRGGTPKSLVFAVIAALSSSLFVAL